MGTWWRFCGGAGLSYAARSGASGDTDVDSLTVTTPRCGPQLLPVLMERPVPQILDFLCSDLGMTPHRARSTGSPQRGDCGDLCPPLQHVGREGRTQKPLHAARPSPLSGGGEGTREDPQLQVRPSDSPLQVRSPQSRKLVSSWGPAQEELRTLMALVPVPALPAPGWVTGARDLPLWASVSSSANGWDGLEMDAQTPARVLILQVPS